MNHVQIKYGKYWDQVTEDFPMEHVILDSFSDITRGIEQGRINLPTQNGLTFSIANLDPDGEERYPMLWWRARERTQAEGAFRPLQIYFEIYVHGALQFRGMMNDLRYTTFNARCVISLETVIQTISGSEVPLLRSFEFESRCMTVATPGQTGQEGGNTLDPLLSLDGEVIQHEALSFSLDEAVQYGSMPILDSDFARHLGWDNNDYLAPGGGSGIRLSPQRSAWVQINDITLLTQVQFVQSSASGTTPDGERYRTRLFVWVYHNAEPPIEIDEGGGDAVIIPQRGQFIDEDGQKIAPDFNARHTLILHEPASQFAQEGALIQFAETPLGNRFIFGTPFVEQPGNIQATQAAYSFFNVLDTVISLANRYMNDIHCLGTGNNFFNKTYITGEHQQAFWADIAMYNFAGDTLEEALTHVTQQLTAVMYVRSDGRIAIHSRDMGQDILDNGFPGIATISDADWERLDGLKYDHGWDTYEAEIPEDIIEINNVVSDTEKKIWATQVGLQDFPSLRNYPVTLSNYRIHDLGVPSAEENITIPVLRYSPGNPNWPHGTTLDDFLPTPQIQIHIIAESLPFPTTTTSMSVGEWFLRPDGSGLPALDVGDYIYDSEEILWWIKQVTVDAIRLTLRCDIQMISPLPFDQIPFPNLIE